MPKADLVQESQECAREKADEALFNQIATHYARKDIARSSSLARKSVLFSALKPILDDNPSLGTIVDIGCGIGAPARYLKGYYQRYVGIDHSQEMIEIAALFNRDNPRAEFIAANIKSEALPKGIADLVLSIGALHHMTELDQVVDSLHKLSKPGAYLVAIEPQQGNPLIQFLRRVRGLIDPAYSREQIFFSQQELRDLLPEHVFNEVHLQHQGFLTPPFAQVTMRPDAIFVPICRGAVRGDAWLQVHLPESLAKLSFNLVAIGRFAGSTS